MSPAGLSFLLLLTLDVNGLGSVAKRIAIFSKHLKPFSPWLAKAQCYRKLSLVNRAIGLRGKVQGPGGPFTGSFPRRLHNGRYGSQLKVGVERGCAATI